MRLIPLLATLTLLILHLSPHENPFIGVADDVRRATVGIGGQSIPLDPFSSEEPGTVAFRSFGSGAIISPDGYILTNAHVLRGMADYVDVVEVVLLDGTLHRAQILIYAPTVDAALLKINTGYKLPYLPMGDSDSMRVAQEILLSGHPGDEKDTTVTGIISRPEGTLLFEDGHRPAIQVTAQINPGQSGGPVVNASGALVGLCMAFKPRMRPLSYLTPINRIRERFEAIQRLSGLNPLGLAE